MTTLFPEDSAERKTFPVFSGLLQYFPAALAKVANHSFKGNEKHNPGQPLHHDRAKSDDEADALLRHLMEGDYVGMAWRALALLQKHLESQGAPIAPGARNAKEHRRVATPAELAAYGVDLPPNLAAACQTRENPLKHVELQAQDDPRAGMVDVAVTAPKFPPYGERNEPKKGHLVRVVEVTWRDEAEGVRLGMTGVVQDNGFAPYVRLHDLRRSHCFSRYQLERIA